MQSSTVMRKTDAKKWDTHVEAAIREGRNFSEIYNFLQQKSMPILEKFKK